MREPERKEIGGSTYVVKPLGAKAHLRLTSKMAHVAGPGLERLINGEGSVNVASAIAALGAMLAKLPEDKFLEIVDVLIATTDVFPTTGVDKKLPLAQVFDQHFFGGSKELYAWLQFALEVHYSPLFEGLFAALGAAAPSPPTGEPSP